MKKDILIVVSIVITAFSCMEPTADIEQQGQVAVSMVLNANPRDSVPEILNNTGYYQHLKMRLGVDISYVVNRVIDKDDTIYVAGDSLNTMIPAQITVSDNGENYSFKTGKIKRDSLTECYYDEFYYTYYYQFLPFVRDNEWQVQAGQTYSVTVKTDDGSEYTGCTRVPGDFHFIPWEDGNYLKKVDNTYWKIRWSPSENGYEYSFSLYGFNDYYTPGRYAIMEAGGINDCEACREFYFSDIQSTDETPGIDAPYPDKFYAQVYVFDENLYRYKYLLQEPAGWLNCLGILGSTNNTAIVFEQELE